jgi:UDP-3-O-[3-hydroxymyristoyl] glucosamine N-acyltransferase
VGRNVVLGNNCVIFANVTVYEGCVLGAGVRVHSGSVIGADGFGYASEQKSNGEVEHHKIYHLGGVVIGDGVEIGANCCVDRGTVGDTRIHAFVKIDNLVQIAHNCEVGEGTIICGSAGMAGSSSTGRYVYVAGGAGLNNQIHVSDGAKIGAACLVSKDVGPGEMVMGNPLREYNDHFRLQAMLNRMIKKDKLSRAEKSK